MSMTKEEAIRILHRYESEHYKTNIQQAHRMAIEALRERGNVGEIDQVRKKLVHLLSNAHSTVCEAEFDNPGMTYSQSLEVEADHLIENGVTVQGCIARPIEEWGEDYGDVLWWKFPIEEPPYVGSPLDAAWPAYHTHWTPIVVPQPPKGE